MSSLITRHHSSVLYRRRAPAYHVTPCPRPRSALGAACPRDDDESSPSQAVEASRRDEWRHRWRRQVTWRSGRAESQLRLWVLGRGAPVVVHVQPRPARSARTPTRPPRGRAPRPRPRPRPKHDGRGTRTPEDGRACGCHRTLQRTERNFDASQCWRQYSTCAVSAVSWPQDIISAESHIDTVGCRHRRRFFLRRTRRKRRQTSTVSSRHEVRRQRTRLGTSKYSVCFLCITVLQIIVPTFYLSLSSTSCRIYGNYVNTLHNTQTRKHIMNVVWFLKIGVKSKKTTNIFDTRWYWFLIHTV